MRLHKQVYLEDATEFQVSHYTLDLRRMSSLLQTLLRSLICILKCDVAFLLILPSTERND